MPSRANCRWPRRGEAAAEPLPSAAKGPFGAAGKVATHGPNPGESGGKTPLPRLLSPTGRPMPRPARVALPTGRRARMQARRRPGSQRFAHVQDRRFHPAPCQGAPHRPRAGLSRTRGRGSQPRRAPRSRGQGRGRRLRPAGLPRTEPRGLPPEGFGCRRGHPPRQRRLEGHGSAFRRALRGGRVRRGNRGPSLLQLRGLA